MGSEYKTGYRVLLWGNYIAKIARVKTTVTGVTYQVTWQHPSEPGDQLTWVDASDLQKF